MSADLLRRAAAKIRETAENVPTGPWWHDSVTGEVRQEQCCPEDEDGQVVAIGNWGPSDPALAHIALWSPDVAELVAAWLEDDAQNVEAHNTMRAVMAGKTNSPPFLVQRKALDLARRILGEPR